MGVGGRKVATERRAVRESRSPPDSRQPARAIKPSRKNSLRSGRDVDNPRIGVLDEIAGYHLRRAFGAMAADFTIAMEGTGLRQVLFAILAVVSSTPGTSQGLVGKVLGIKRANMVALINELIDRGL